MTGTTTQFTQLLDEIDRTPWGPAEQRLVAEAVALAQELGDEQLEYLARMRQTASANMGGATDVMLNSFAWCLARHDADPVRFPADIDNGGADLMWQFKWMAAALRSSPAFSQEQIAAVLDDMEQHYRRAGLGLSGVLTARFEDAWDAGRMAEAEALRIQLEATPRDDHSHCDACGRSQAAGFFVATDRDAEAIRLVEEMIEGGFSCGEEPEHALARVLLPYLRAGRFEDARTAHLRSYRLAKDNPDNLTIVAANIVFCAVTGNEARALALVERHLPWLAHDGLNVDGHFTALASFAFALDRVGAAGHADAVVRGADSPALQAFFGPHDGDWTAEGLAAAAWARADGIAAEFDARDASDGHAARLVRLRDLADARYDMPIRSDAFVAPAATAYPTDADGWFDRVTDLADYGAEAETLTALPHALGVSDPDRRARVHGIRIAVLVAAGRDAEADALRPERVEALRAAGRADQAALEERVGLAVFGAASAEDAAALDRELADETLPADAKGDVAVSRASLHLRAGEQEQALALAEIAHRAFAEAGDTRHVHGTSLLAIVALVQSEQTERAGMHIDRLLSEADLSDGHRARALEVRARIRGGQGAFAEGASDADEVCRLLATFGATSALTTAHLLAGALWEDAGDAPQAVTRYRLAAHLAARDEADLSGVDFRLARAMLSAGDAAEAAELFGDVLRREEETDVEASSRATTAMMLARSLAASGEFGQAVGAFGYAAELYGQGEQPADQAMAMTEQAKILARFDEADEAVDLLERAAEIARTEPETVGALVEVLHSLGQAYAGKADDRSFALFDEVAALAAQHEAGWLLADVTDSRARAQATLGRVEEAVATALTAADGFAALGDSGAAAGSELFAARVLTGADRAEDAVAIYHAVLARESDVPGLRQIAGLELGDVLDSLGRHAEAGEARAAAEA